MYRNLCCVVVIVCGLAFSCPAGAGVVGASVKRAFRTRAVAGKAVKRAGKRSVAGRAMRRSAGRRTRCRLVERIVAEANRVAAPGGRITRAQLRTLRGNLPRVARRGRFATRAMRKEFVREKKRIIRNWERKTGRTWPGGRRGRKATLHHVIPLESGGANKWWNAMPTFGRSPTHAVRGARGPHSRNSVLRRTIQRSRRSMGEGTVTDLLRPE